MKAKEILRSKGGAIVSITEASTVAQAVAALAQHKIGFLIVNDASGAFAGVLSERDVVQKCVSGKKDTDQVPVSAIMTPKERVITGTEEEDIESIMNTMTERKIRHLPIFNGPQLKGIISIGDVIKTILQAKDEEIKTLSSYVSGNYPG
jgi:CBS domain-containing protein